MWFNRYNSFKFTFQVNMQSHPEYSVSLTSTNQTLHNFFINASNVSVVNASCPLGI